MGKWKQNKGRRMDALFFLTSPLLPCSHHRAAMLRGGRRWRNLERCCVNSEVMAFTVCRAPNGPHELKRFHTAHSASSALSYWTVWHFPIIYTFVSVAKLKAALERSHFGGHCTVLTLLWLHVSILAWSISHSCQHSWAQTQEINHCIAVKRLG